MKKVLLILPVFLLLTGCSLGGSDSSNPTPTVSPADSSTQSASKGGNLTLTRIDASVPTEKKTVVVTMENGNTFTLTLYPDLAPKTVENFINKAKGGHYSGLTFHRVEANDTGKTWVVQGGDPIGNGTGGGDQAAEYNNRTFKVGSLGIARGGDPNINNDSQFFVTTQDSSFLDKNYTNFGDVTSGMDKVMLIKVGDKIKSMTAE